MTWMGRAAALLAAGVLACAAQAGAGSMDFNAQRPSADARSMQRWVQRTGDADGMPYLIVDKKQARLYVFDARGRLAATTSVLLGSSRGDHTVPGVGQRAQTGQLAPDERTTPAGRFVTHPGRNLQGEHVVWVDYAAAFAIHRLRPGASHRARVAQLATPTPRDNRSSLGCVVVPVRFYLDVVQPLLGRASGVVYVLPETRSLPGMLQALESLDEG